MSDVNGSAATTVAQDKVPSLQAVNIRKTFGETVVLHDISLDVHTHEVVCLIGASGSGKSTLLRCLDLLEPLDDGAIFLSGEEISAPGVNLRRIQPRIGLVFQAFNLFPHMTLLDNVALGPRRVRGVSASTAREQAHEILTRFGLANKVNEYPDRVSGGQQQRVAIARALVMDPEVMLFDEVTSALDPELVGEVLEVIRGLKESGITMVMATHEMPFVRQVADTVCFLENGVIVEQGPPEQMFTEPAQEQTQRFLKRVIEAGRL